MAKLRRSLALAGFGVWFIGPGLPAAPARAASSTLETHARLALESGAYDRQGGPAPQALGARLDVTLDQTWLFDNGVSAGVSVVLAAERDNKARDPRGGLAGSCPAGIADCAGVRSPVSGFYGAGATASRGPRAAVEAGYLFIRGGWGEASLGRDQGAAARFSLGAPSVLSVVGAADPSVDLTGFGGVVTVNDLSGSSAKVTAASPRILGLRAGVSFTPDEEANGLDQGFAGGPFRLKPQAIAEFGLSFSRTWANGWRTDLGATLARAEDRSQLAMFGPMRTWGAGIQLAKGGWRFGGAYLDSDNGWRTGGRGYRAGATGVTYEREKWGFMAQFGAAQDDLAWVKSKALLVAARREIDAHVSVAAGISAAWRDTPQIQGGFRGVKQERSAGPFVEFVCRL